MRGECSACWNTIALTNEQTLTAERNGLHSLRNGIQSGVWSTTSRILITVIIDSSGIRIVASGSTKNKFPVSPHGKDEASQATGNNINAMNEAILVSKQFASLKLGE